MGSRRIDAMPEGDFKPGNPLYDNARYNATGTLVDGRMEAGQVDYYHMFNGTITPLKPMTKKSHLEFLQIVLL